MSEPLPHDSRESESTLISWSWSWSSSSCVDIFIWIRMNWTQSHYTKCFSKLMQSKMFVNRLTVNLNHVTMLYWFWIVNFKDTRNFITKVQFFWFRVKFLSFGLLCLLSFVCWLKNACHQLWIELFCVWFYSFVVVGSMLAAYNHCNSSSIFTIDSWMRLIVLTLLRDPMNHHFVICQFVIYLLFSI